MEKAQNTLAAMGGLGKADPFATNQSTGQSELEKIVNNSTNQGTPPAQGSTTEVSNAESENPTGAQQPPAGETAQNGESANSGEAQQKSEATEEGKEKAADSPNTRIGFADPEEKSVVTSFEKLEDVEKFVKDNGIELKDLPVKLPELFESAKKLQTLSEDHAKVQAVLENMPAEMYQAMVEWSHGRDWRTVIHKTEPLNFEAPADKHDSEKLVETYFPGKISKEDWEEFKDADGDETVKQKVKDIIAMSKDKYGIDQEKFKFEKQKIETNAARTLAVREESFKKSRTSVQDQFKTTGLKVDDKYLSDLDKNLSSDQAILAVYKNPDGTLKPEAHRMMAMAIDGFDLVLHARDKMKRQIVTEQRTELLQKNTGNQPIKKSGDTAQSGVSESEKRVKEYISKVAPKNMNDSTFS